MQIHNQHVPSPLPIQQGGFGGSKTASGASGGYANTPHRDGIIFLSETRDATGTGSHPAGSASGVYTSDPIINVSAMGVRIFVNIVTGATTGTTTVKLQAQDPASLNWFDITGAATAAIAGNTTGAALVVHPAVTVVANSAVSQVLGPVWRVVATQALAPATFSVGADYVI